MLKRAIDSNRVPSVSASIVTSLSPRWASRSVQELPVSISSTIAHDVAVWSPHQASRCRAAISGPVRP